MTPLGSSTTSRCHMLLKEIEAIKIKSIRLPRRIGQHSDFAFVEFGTKQEANNVVQALSRFHRSTPSIPCNHMALPSSESKESYCRKQKSLGLLCTNFLSLYNQDGIETIGLDDAATRLGVERRRIYDIVNVLESVGVLARKAKNRYSWKGFGEVPKALEELREEGLRENGNDYTRVSDDDEDENNPTPITSSQEEKTNPSSHTRFSMASKTGKVLKLNAILVDNRKEKSLGLLTQNFIKLFLCTDVDLISLEEAAKILLGDARDPSTMRSNSAAKVRRLYDIANVLSSMNFIEKVHHPDTRKPAFRWLGMKEKLEDGSANCFVPIESKKRTFGTEITNTSFKRTKLIDGNLNQITKPLMQMQMQVKREVLENEFDKTNLERDSRECPKSYQFGPFAPVSVSKAIAAENKKVKQVHAWESLASTFRPEYHNQALRDLFDHYLEAWQSWYSEVAGKKPIQLMF
ncbi:hypothetical protein RHMOL_Rhmol08G0228700 [Rhododendron molle]|uniref:Uncharacterized protein n=1 Tax=Rhododendron molle TaxID=49168 RepID=A0ACC0MTG2_RHOML|nr:hypothetical protein RHMOL_Rhmol08G0228700 [Rhododendron molle]